MAARTALSASVRAVCRARFGARRDEREKLGFIEDAAATLDLPFEFGDARGQLRQFRLAVTKALQDA